MIKKIIIAGLVFASTAAQANSSLVGVADNAGVNDTTGIRVPAGFEATVFADKIGQARHVVAANNGWIYAALRRGVKGKGAVALKDNDGDGVSDESVYFAKGIRGTGIGIYDGHLYFGTDVSILRWKLPEAGAPKGKPELIAYGFGAKRQHAAKSFTFDGKGGLYVNVGAPSDACMGKQRQKGSPGMDPCPILAEYGGIWKFDANKPMQNQLEDGVRYATGLRNAVGVDWNPHADSLYLAQHGRDQLAEMFPELYTLEESAELPAEEFHKVPEGADLGWPYSYYDQFVGSRMKMPEYGGDGKEKSDIGQDPVAAFPGHWAPNDVLFSRSGKLPEAYSKGAFIAFHGSWNRAPMPQQGYRVVYLPLDESGAVNGDWITFADSFAGVGVIKSPRDAKHRPTGLAEGPDGSIYITSSMSGGRVYRVQYVGD